MDIKNCTRCKRYLPVEKFGVKSSNKDGLQSWCNDCKIEYNHRWYEANKERHRDYVNSHKDRSKHVCKGCGKSEPEVSFYIKKEKGKFYPRFLCRDCEKKYRKKYPRKVDSSARRKEKQRMRERLIRTDDSLRCLNILRDSRKRDKDKGVENDLDREFIRELIDSGCSYCFDDKGRMTLDRIDNSIGHIKTNVVASCMRCNYIRRDMPHEVWMMIVPKIRQARLLGMLEGWNPGTTKNQSKADSKKIAEEMTRGLLDDFLEA